MRVRAARGDEVIAPSSFCASLVRARRVSREGGQVRRGGRGWSYSFSKLKCPVEMSGDAASEQDSDSTHPCDAGGLADSALRRISINFKPRLILLKLDHPK